MFDVTFPVTDGLIVTTIRAALGSWSNLTVQRDRPETMPKRLVTVRNDGGPVNDVRAIRRYGINVWADSSLDAEKIALDAMNACRGIPSPVKRVDEFSGPYEIQDEPRYTFNGASLTHFYFTFRATVRGQ